jgi:hypothetical protein
MSSNGRNRRAASAVIPAVALGWLTRRSLKDNVCLAILRWRQEPKAMAVDLAVSLVYGQGVMWTIGQDFIGFGMKPIWRPGFGHKIAPIISGRLPHTPCVYWSVKTLELVSDATKMPIEGRLFQDRGVVPDVVAQGVTQPLWSYIEVLEKLYGLVIHPERVEDAQQLEDSISSIYGTWTRNIASFVWWRYGPRMLVALRARN